MEPFKRNIMAVYWILEKKRTQLEWSVLYRALLLAEDTHFVIPSPLIHWGSF